MIDFRFNRSSIDQRRSSAIFDEMEQMTVESIFDSVVLRLLEVTLLCGVLVLLGSLINAFGTEWHPIVAVQLVVMAGICLVFIFRRRLSQRIVALSLLTSLFVLGVSALAFFGLLGGTGPLVFVAFSILVGTLYGFRSGLVAGASSVLIYALAALGIKTGLLPIYAIAADKYLHSIPFWIYVGADMAVVIISAIYCISEIQERMVSAIAISRAEHTFATAALNVQRDLFIVIDPVTFKPVHWNLTLRRLSGLTESEIKSRPIPKGWATFVDPVAAEEGLVKLKQREVETFEIAIRAASGEVIPFEIRLDRTFPAGDGEGLIILFGRDLRERRAAEAALMESERRNRLIIENVPAVPWIADHFGQHTYLSPNIETITGFTADDVVARGFSFWFEQVHPDDRCAVEQSVTRLFSKEIPYDISYRFKRKDARWIWLQDRAHALLENNTPYACGVLLDITEQVVVAERLRHSEKMEAIGQLAGGVAHDFNNQLAAIVGCGELLSTLSDGDPLVAQYAAHVRNCARHASVLTRKLLTFSRKDALEKVPVNVHGVLDEVVSLIERSFDKRINIDTRFGAESPTILGDASELQSALLNLCINSRDAMPDGGRITLSTSAVKKRREPCQTEPGRLLSGDFIRITVEDTGIGMDSATIRRIFEPFFTTKPKGEGTGMGLATVFGFVRTLNGDIAVQSKPGAGTAIRIDLPMMMQTAQNDTTRRNRPIDANRGTILLVDDETVVNQVVADMLVQLGYEVERCSDGADAVERYRTKRDAIDLVILDMVMPKLGGKDTFSALWDINREIKVLLATGKAMDEQIETVLANGAKGYLQKPFTADELAAKIDAVLQDG